MPAPSPRSASSPGCRARGRAQACGVRASRRRFALDGAHGNGDRIALKWPNDVLLDGAKLAGILLEAEKAPDGRMAVVVGIGVNVRHAPTDLPYPAASLAGLGSAADAEAVFAALSECWCEAAAAWDDGRGFPAVRARWLERASGLGGQVAVRIDGEVTRGIFETIDDTGCWSCAPRAGRAAPSPPARFTSERRGRPDDGGTPERTRLCRSAASARSA
jgi:biotin-(acetyl-CoA carboxylase) ligase